MPSFEEKLYTLRKEKRWSQEHLAEQLDVTRQTISKWESGAAMPELNKLRQLSAIFGVTMDALVNNELPLVPEEAPAAEGKARGKRMGFGRSWIVSACLLAAAVILVVLNCSSPSYNSTKSVRDFVSGQLRQHAPYLSLSIVDIDPESIRKHLESLGVELTLDDLAVAEAIAQALSEYFQPFQEYGLVYDPENHSLFYEGQGVEVFQVYNDYYGSSHSWYGEGTAVLFAEQNRQGTVTDFFLLED